MQSFIKQKQVIFISIGLAVFAGSQILSHYFDMPDFLEGIMMGTGVGLMIAGLMKNKKVYPTD